MSTPPTPTDRPVHSRGDRIRRNEHYRPVDRAGRRSVYVWELPVRMTHWTTVISIVVLTITGFWLHNPFLAPPARYSWGHPGFTLGTVRFIHEVTAAVFIAGMVGRAYWGFVGNKYARWRAMLPLTAHQRQRLRNTLKYYAYVRRDPPPSVGHNPLASLAYLALCGGFVVSVLTGLSLFAWIAPTSPLHSWLSWTWTIIPIQYVDLIHFLVMFWFLAFAIHHVYSAVLIDLEERNGELSSMVTGWKLDNGEEDDF
jgi:Ni/Fe-hydrogenase 1 B-type cytochrome subunit